jgi:hypothetical protein
MDTEIPALAAPTVHASTLLSTNGLAGTVVRDIIFDEVLSRFSRSNVLIDIHPDY